MKKNLFLLFFTLILIVFGSISTLFFYPERTQTFIIETFNFKKKINDKVQYFFSRKINDENIKVNIETINFLKPEWPNIAKFRLKNVSIFSLGQKRKSNIKFIEIGLSYHNLFKIFLSNENDIHFNHIDFQDLKLNARIDKDKFVPGPLIKIFSLINQNNFQVSPNIKKLIKNKVDIGEINFLLVDNRDLRMKRILEINCENVFISESVRKSRLVEMLCKKEQDNLLFLKANLYENYNTFSGEFKNFDTNFFMDDWLIENFQFITKGFNSHLNGSYNIRTNKDFRIENVKIETHDSFLISYDKYDEEISEIRLNGEFTWDRKNNLLKFSNIILDNQLVAFGEIDLKSKKGSLNFSTKTILMEDFKIYLKKYSNFYPTLFRLNFNKTLNEFKGGNLTNLSVDLKFTLLKNFIIEEITGLSNFSNIQLDRNDKIFKKIHSRMSGDLKFGFYPKNTKENLAQLKLIASDGFVIFNDLKFQYEFTKALISGNLYDDHFIISQADFFKKNNLEYSFQNVKISNNEFNIEKVQYINNNKLQYEFNDTLISNLNVKKSFLKIKNNEEISSFIKRRFDIELIGDVETGINLSGNLKNLNFQLNLNSNLKNSYLNIHYLDLIKKKNIASSIMSKILVIKGNIAVLKNTYLKVENDIYEIGLIELNKNNVGKVSIKNLKTPKLNIDEILFTKDGKNVYVEVTGKKIDLSNLSKNLKSKNQKTKSINLDLTADLIRLNSKISLTGNLKGKIKDNSFNSIAYGKLLLGGKSLIDNGEFKLNVNNKISRLEGLGSVGGAETKINLQKKINSFPSLLFETSDGGKLLSALGFTKNIKSGDMKININFLNNEYNHYNGNIKSKKFSLINAPGIINALSVLSFSGIGSIISGEGVFFDKGQVNINVQNKIFNFDKLYLSSESLGIAAQGKINFKKKSINMNGSIAPIKLISKILSVVPAVGELLTGLKKEGLFAGQFKMVGLIEKPEIKLNTMSFAPGILRDLFSENWLDNKNNFFINKTIN